MALRFVGTGDRGEAVWLWVTYSQYLREHVSAVALSSTGYVIVSKELNRLQRTSKTADCQATAQLGEK